MNNNEQIKDIVQTIVGNPDEVSVSVVDDSQSTVLELKVSESDLVKVIGKQGLNVQAIRTILGALSDKSKKRVVLEIV